jgi:predicted Zn-dependent protease
VTLHLLTFPIMNTLSWLLCSVLYRTCLTISIIVLFALTSPAHSSDSEIRLPMLGDSSSGIVSKYQEYQLGREWLKVFRSRVQTFDDPLMQNYLENLLYNLATYSELEDPKLELVIVVSSVCIQAFFPLHRLRIRWYLC